MRLTEIVFPDRLRFLSKWAFFWTFGLEYVGLDPDIRLRELPERSFYRTQSLLHVFIPNGIEEIGDECLSLVTFVFE
jgi:hypothetical protein